MSTTVKLPRISGRDRVVVLPNGKAVIQAKGRRTGPKMSKSRRMKLAAAARRFKIPVLTAAAIGVPFITAVKWAGGLGTALSTTEGFLNAGGALLGFYTGYNPNVGDWKFKRLAYGLMPLLGVTIVKRLGIFKGVNTTLAKNRIPLRLS